VQNAYYLEAINNIVNDPPIQSTVRSAPAPSIFDQLRSDFRSVRRSHSSATCSAHSATSSSSTQN